VLLSFVDKYSKSVYLSHIMGCIYYKLLPEALDKSLPEKKRDYFIVFEDDNIVCYIWNFFREDKEQYPYENKAPNKNITFPALASLPDGSVRGGIIEQEEIKLFLGDANYFIDNFVDIMEQNPFEVGSTFMLDFAFDTELVIEDAQVSLLFFLQRLKWLCEKAIKEDKKIEIWGE
jgi:hypothetical protein